MRTGILGTGDVGRALGKAFIAVGHESRWDRAAPRMKKPWRGRRRWAPSASSGTFADAAAFGELIVLATLGVANESALRSAGPEKFRGKLVIDTTNPLDFSGGRAAEAGGQRQRLRRERVQRLLPDAHVVKAFNTVGNRSCFVPNLPDGPPDMFIAGNMTSQKRGSPASSDFGWGVVDVGGIESSRYFEAMCMVWVLSGMRISNWNLAFKLLRK